MGTWTRPVALTVSKVGQNKLQKSWFHSTSDQNWNLVSYWIALIWSSTWMLSSRRLFPRFHLSPRPPLPRPSTDTTMASSVLARNDWKPMSYRNVTLCDPGRPSLRHITKQPNKYVEINITLRVVSHQVDQLDFHAATIYRLTIKQKVGHTKL